MKHTRLDTSPQDAHDKGPLKHSTRAPNHTHFVRRLGEWAGTITFIALTLLVLLQGLGSDAWAATLAPDVPILSDNLANALSSEIAEVLPFL